MVGQKLVAIVTVYAVLASPLLANAQCKADVDCKGDRICERGKCVDPRTRQPDSPPPPATPPPPTSPPPKAEEDDGVKVTISDIGAPTYDDYDTGWALTAGIIGLVGAVATAGLHIGAALTRNDDVDIFDVGFEETEEIDDDEVPALPLLAAGVASMAVLGGLSFAGGRSARSGTGATGSLGLRIGGWIAFGVSAAVSLFLMLYDAVDLFNPPEPLYIASGLVGATSCVLFAVDALLSHSEASQGVISSTPSLLPALVWARESGGNSVPGLGVRAAF
jgi:hypothetical protein